MKKYIWILGVILFIYPIVVKAYIVCNDGTTSPSCSTCHQGCCSRHGGCSNSPSSNNSSNSSSSSNKKQSVIETKSADNSLKKVSVDGEDILIMDNMFYLTTQNKVTILANANDSKAIVNYDKNLDLTMGENIINIKVTAENGETKNYILKIEREEIKNKKEEEINDIQIVDEDEMNIFTSLGSFALLGGASYLIYKRVKKNS